MCERERGRQTKTQIERESDSELTLSHAKACAGTLMLLINDPPSKHVLVLLQDKQRRALVMVCTACPIHSPSLLPCSGLRGSPC